MGNILKLTVKKDVFDKLASGEQNYVYVEANGYWIRRLALNSSDSFDKLKETQAFRIFDSVAITCAKENAEYPFKSIRTGYEDMSQDGFDTGIVVWMNIETKNEVEQEIESIEDETETDEEIELTTDFTDVTKVEVKETNQEIIPIKNVVKKEVKNTEHKINLKKSIDFIIDVVGGYDNVLVVNRPKLIVTSHGRIFGTKDRLDINNEEEIKINVGMEKFYDETNSDEDFLKSFEKYLCEYAKSGCIFIWKDGCDVITTPSGRYVKMMMSKKMYLNR